MLQKENSQSISKIRILEECKLESRMTLSRCWNATISVKCILTRYPITAPDYGMVTQNDALFREPDSTSDK